jgi:diguanylate cyclase (GGDEF)-like protein
MTPSTRPRVLVAEDDRVLQDLVAELLSEAGYDVATASDGDEALQLARELAPDLVLLDVTMPLLDGYTVCRELRASGPTAPQVIFLTAHGAVEDRVAGLDLGAVDYLVKPFNPPELEARVRAALRTKAALDALAADATTDPLTGLLNRRQLEARAAAAIHLARRHRRPLSCLLLDIDHFKEVNDRYGHLAGDAVLREVARRLRESIRRSDVVARFGGEEFLLLLPETECGGALLAAERIRRYLAAAPVALPPPRPALFVTASIGVAGWSPDLPDAAALFEAADRALYQAKGSGRDRVAPAAGPRTEARC